MSSAFIRVHSRLSSSGKNMEPWYKVATPRKEVREGRSFNPDEFAIALEQVVSREGPDLVPEEEQEETVD